MSPAEEETVREFAAFVNANGGTVVAASSIPPRIGERLKGFSWKGTRIPVVFYIIREATLQEFLSCQWPTFTGKLYEGDRFWLIGFD